MSEYSVDCRPVVLYQVSLRITALTHAMELLKITVSYQSLVFCVLLISERNVRLLIGNNSYMHDITYITYFSAEP